MYIKLLQVKFVLLKFKLSGVENFELSKLADLSVYWLFVYLCFIKTVNQQLHYSYLPSK